jgi:putative DNA primase/helicase
MQLWIGSGANGKSCLARVVKALHRSFAALRLNDLDGFSLAEAVDASLLYCDELPTFGLHEETLKALITGEPLRINRKHRSAITTSVTARIIAMGNVLPSIRDSSDGVWRRIEVVPFDQHVAPDKIDPFLAERIIAEDLSGVLNWALEGLSRVMKRGFKLEPRIPSKMEAAMLQNRAESDSVYAWLLEEPVSITDKSHTPKGIVYNEYHQWCKHGQIRALNVVQFWKALRKAIPNLQADHRPRINGGVQVVCCNLKLPRKSY